jgi:hypothetical protein
MGDSAERHNTNGLDPAHTSVFRWAWANAREWRAEWWFGGVVFGLLGTVAGFTTPSSWGSKPELALMAFGMAVIATTLGSLIYAILVALYQQRNALRRKLSQAEPPKPNDDTSHGYKLSQKAQAGKGSIIIQGGRDVRVEQPQPHSEESSS